MRVLAVTRSRNIVLALAALVAVLVFLPPANTSAVQGSDFRANNIIDDAIFNNNSSMSAEQIQNFLNSKVPTCDTNGTKMYNSTQSRAQYGASTGNPAPYTCLKSYVQTTSDRAAETGLCSFYPGGTKSSAQIIADVSQACGINPQVLLVLLQKEQSLVTDDWPWNIQYRSATGFGCPDTAPCDAEYYGFFNQVYNAARIYKKYARDANYYNYASNRTNYIQYNPNSGCSGTNLFLSNQAAAGLYNYTPYQPNTAALNNLYGSGDGCSAYGNRNFWRMFNDWFGNTNLPTVIKSSDSPAVYLQTNSYKFYVPDAQIATDFSVGGAQTLPKTTFDSVPSPDASSGLSSSLGNLVKSPSDTDGDGGAVYLISQGRKYVVTDMAQFNNFGFNTSNLTYLPLGYIYSLPSAGNLSNFIQQPNSTVFKVENGAKRLITDGATYDALNPSGSITRVSYNFASKIVSGNVITNTPLLLGLHTGSIYLVLNGSPHYVPSTDVLRCWGFTDTLNMPLFTPTSDSYIGPVTPVDTLNCSVKGSDNTTYLLNHANRVSVGASYGYASTTTSPDLVSLATKLPARSPTLGNVIQAENTPAVWIVEGGSRKLIPSMIDLSLLSIPTTSIDKITAGALAEIPQGKFKLGVGRPVMSNSSGAVYIVTSSSTKAAFSSYDDFLAYKEDGGSILSVPAADLDTLYPTALANVSKYLYNSQGTVYLMDPSGCYGLSDDQLVRYGQPKVSSQPYPDSVFYNVNYVNCKPASAYVKSPNDPAVYEVNNAKKYPISSWSKLQSLSNSTNPYVVTLSDTTLATLPTGPAL